MGSLAPRIPQYLVVVGGSYVGSSSAVYGWVQNTGRANGIYTTGTKAAEQLALKLHDRYRVLLIEKNSHFQHLFAFPRFAVTTQVDTHKAFIPYGVHTFGACPPGSGSFIQAKVTGLSKYSIQLDRKVSLDGNHVDSIPYAFLILATGTKLTPPSSMSGSEKLDGVQYLRKHADMVKQRSKIVLIGAGAVGVQMATDIKELYPNKSVTLVHSRKHVMNKFIPQFHELIAERFTELGIETKLGSRVKLPPQGYPTDGSIFYVELEDGTSIPADFAIICTGQIPQSQILESLSPKSIDSSGYIKVLKSLQINDPQYPNVFAVGDVADTGAHKAAKPATKQVDIVVRNIEHMLASAPLEDYRVDGPPAIHMTLGITKNVIFGNPEPGSSEPFLKWRDDGELDMGIDGVWARRGGGVDPML